MSKNKVFENYIIDYQNLKNGKYRITLRGGINITYDQGEFIEKFRNFQYYGSHQRKNYIKHRKRYLKLKKILKYQKELLETFDALVQVCAWEEEKRIPRSKLSDMEIGIIESFRATHQAIYQAEINYKESKKKLEENIFKFEKFIDCNNKLEAVRKIENHYLKALYNPKTQIGEKFVNKLYDENF